MKTLLVLLSLARNWYEYRLPRSVKFSFNLTAMTLILFVMASTMLPVYSSITGVLFIVALFLLFIFFADWRTYPERDPLTEIIEKGNLAYATLILGYCILAGLAITRI